MKWMVTVIIKKEVYHLSCMRGEIYSYMTETTLQSMKIVMYKIQDVILKVSLNQRRNLVDNAYKIVGFSFIYTEGNIHYYHELNYVNENFDALSSSYLINIRNYIPKISTEPVGNRTRKNSFLVTNCYGTSGLTLSERVPSTVERSFSFELFLEIGFLLLSNYWMKVFTGVKLRTLVINCVRTFKVQAILPRFKTSCLETR